MEAQRIRDGVKSMQEGDKAASKGLFRKPDWDVASGCYDRAATAFKVGKSYDQAVQAYVKASEAFFKADGTHLAGKALENAALILVQNLDQPQKAAEMYQRASDLFMTNGSIDRAAEQLQKAGRALENTDVSAAIEMYSSACTLYEQEDRGRFAIDIYKKAISLLVRSKKLEKAVDMLHRQAAVLQKLTNRSHLCKANLSILIVLFAIGDEVEAGKQFNIMCSEDAEIGQALLQAYEEGDQELLEKTVRRQHVSFLDNEVAKLSRTLTVPGEMLSQPTAAAGRQPTAHASGGYGRQMSPRGQQQQQQQPPTPLSSGMSPAQMRAELYSTPSRPSEKSTPPPPPQAPVAAAQPPPPPYAVPQQPPPPTQEELDQEFARLNMNNEKYYPPTSDAQALHDHGHQQPRYEPNSHPSQPPAPHQNPPPKFEEEDDWDDLR
ncbi:hypothetical protein BCR43DRAFT_442992 [Syncephalastrum racemosum]|uniref:Gamma-soluble NSF attachment protein n=1 Tax=Syncephalastrum racemosum TaxID=13706 RepID=A0A1X2H5X1_SYNRA|nr:hypothetical protein BCR43DRAFT_442992 [Syncephalastrum racemosum]